MRSQARKPATPESLANSSTAKVVRDRPGSERRLIEAVGEIIAREGFDALGARNVARQAGLDPKLVRVYFGNLDGLLDAYADSTQHWPSVEELTDDGAIADLPLAQRAARVLTNLARAFQARPMLHELLRAELSHQNQLMARLKARRQEVSMEVTRRYFADLAASRGGVEGTDLLGLMAAAIHYLAIRVAHPDQGFLNLGIARPEDMARLTRLIDAVCETCLGEPSPATP